MFPTVKATVGIILFGQALKRKLRSDLLIFVLLTSSMAIFDFLALQEFRFCKSDYNSSPKPYKSRLLLSLMEYNRVDFKLIKTKISFPMSFRTFSSEEEGRFFNVFWVKIRRKIRTGSMVWRP